MNYPKPLSPEQIIDLLLTLEFFLEANPECKAACDMLKAAKELYEIVNNEC